jgi:glycosyltransferase involved in cell wall biosynthesis
VHVIPPGVDRERFTPGDRDVARRQLGWPSDVPVAFTVRRLVPRMGLDVLLRAWAAVTPAEALLVIAGDGPERPALERLRAELGLADRVRLVGRIDDAALVSSYQAADVVVVPTVALEGFGLIAAEALACGTPVVASDTDGLRDALSALPADLLVPAGDVTALTRRLSDGFDGTRPLPDADACRAASERFAWPAIVAAHLEVYRAAAGLPAAEPDAQPTARRRIKVVYVDHTAAPSGAELAMLRLIPAVPDVDAHVILGADGPLVGLLRDAGISVEVLAVGDAGRRTRDAGVGPASALSIVPATLRLARRLRELKPDLVHTNSLKSNLYGGIAARLAGVPAVWHQQDRLADDYLRGRTATTIRLFADRLPAAVIGCSQTALDTVHLHRRPGWAIPSPGAVTPVERSPRGNDTPLVVGSMSRISPWKGQHVLLEAFAAAFGGPGRQERLVIYGEPLFGEEPYAARLRADAERLGIAGQVEFAGHTDDAPAALAAMDVLVHCPVIPEPFGQVVPEGMGAGLPVITTDAGGPAEVITDDVNGLLVARDDVAALTAALKRVAGDPALRHRLGAQAAVTAQDYRPAAIGPRVRAVYDVVLAAR